MALVTKLYLKHPDQLVLTLVETLLLALNDHLVFDEETGLNEVHVTTLSRLATAIHREKGEALTAEFIESIGSHMGFDFRLGSVSKVKNGFLLFEWSSESENFWMPIDLLVYLLRLVPKLQAHAWSCNGDDSDCNSSELWLKAHKGRLYQFAVTPLNGNDDSIYGTVYRFWHDGLPGSIKHGLLNASDELIVGQGNIPNSNYLDWLELVTDSMIMVSDENELATDKEAERNTEDFWDAGPKLSKQLLASIRAICRAASGSTDFATLLNAIADVSDELVELEREYNTGIEVHEENSAELRGYITSLGGLLAKAPFEQHMPHYLSDILKEMAQERMLKTLIVQHDEVLMLMRGLEAAMDDEELMQLFTGDSIERYDDFVLAKNILVQMVELYELQDLEE